MKVHNATNMPAASACQPDAVRGEDLVDMDLLNRIAGPALSGASPKVQERLIAAVRMVIMGHSLRQCAISLGIKYGTLTGGTYSSAIREIAAAYQAQKGGGRSLASLASNVDVDLVQRLGLKLLAKPASLLGQNILAIAALSLQGLPMQDIAQLVGLRLQTLKKTYLSKANRICAEYKRIKNPQPQVSVIECSTAHDLPRLNGALIHKHEVSMSAIWRGLERWRSVA
ncbi:hypothetical protein AmDm5_0495 [Acetobacter malorum]|uniref:Uncharacterized protein n=1 Tax=Acetobacter malorum TaxID=178901 RepID=A0A087PXF1_9PROT|nr:hypothetical protein [Acetobacter malorum]KFL92054.1 hypothetical protein AmDm5_0495 [Acetobacter malorum]OAG78490.1 hypothetical protein Amal_00503 [Acetobacter malorum]